MAARKPLLIAVVYIGVFLGGAFLASLICPKFSQGSMHRVPSVAPAVAQAVPTWKHWEDYSPAWEDFKDDHSHEYTFWETEIYRGGKRSVNRFYIPK